MTQFSDSELERYARHLVLPEIGGPGQQRLKQSSILVVGAGGLGAPVLQYLAAAGVGKLVIIDDDDVSLSNLQRQVIHDTDAVGVKKVLSAQAAITALNPHVEVELHPHRLTTDNADHLIQSVDLVIDGTDNFATRYLLADRCEACQRPLVSGAGGRFDGSVTTLVPFKCNAEGVRNPGYRDLFPGPPAPGSVPSCAEAGILGALTGLVGTIQALEAIKYLTGAGECLIGRLLLIDSLAMRFEVIRYRRQKESDVD